MSEHQQTQQSKESKPTFQKLAALVSQTQVSNPASIIQRFLTEKPKGAIGLAVPGMPMGSPGMEMGNHFDPYDVLLLKADGSSSVYVHIGRIDQQH